MTHLAPLPSGPVRRVAFLGTPAMAVPVLDALVDADFDVAMVISRIDKRRGRGSDVVPSPVKERALALGIPVGHRVDELLDLHAREPVDLAVVVAYGALIKAHVLQVLPMVNIHVSLLPRWRGAAPIERALLAGDEETGVCIMQVEEGLDTGGVLALARMPIGADTTADDIRSRLIVDGTDLLLGLLRHGMGVPVPQVGEPSSAPKIDPSELRIRWSGEARELSRLVRVGDAWTMFRGKRVKIHSVTVHDDSFDPGTIRVIDDAVMVGTANGSIRLGVVQPEGKNRMDARSWVNGLQLSSSESFDDA